jgi:hypothetical protein
MPQKRLIRRTVGNDIEAVRATIVAGVHLLPWEAQHDPSRYLTHTQRALLAHVAPTYKTAMRYLSHCQPSVAVIAAARIALENELGHILDTSSKRSRAK